MGARPTSTKPTERAAGKGRGTRKLNRSEQQAMRIRAAATAAARAAAEDDVPAPGARPMRAVDPARVARTAESAPRPASKASRTRQMYYGTVLSREQEMAFVRADLMRLLWIGGVILVAMFILLAVL